jgi:hypothetical protein
MLFIPRRFPSAVQIPGLSETSLPQVSRITEGLLYISFFFGGILTRFGAKLLRYGAHFLSYWSGLYLHKVTQRKNTNICVLRGIRTYNPTAQYV